MRYYNEVGPRLAELLREWRGKRRASQRVLADWVGLKHSVVSRAEKGIDARISTWETLFTALGLRMVITLEESEGGEDSEDHLIEETSRRHLKRVEWLDWRLR